MTKTYRFCLWLLTVATTVSFGCSYDSGPPKYPVSGMVTYQGDPIPDGMIVFFPTEPGGGAQVGVKIVDGKYAGKTTDGVMRVYVEASRPGPMVKDDMGVMHESLDWYIPSKYNDQSTLTCEILPEDNKELNFDLK
ncbi:hypothetical protein LOC68_14385 [Blastopirellula sp. JC732]|uniref:Carboxypeptidase regulatory-like domain-containing protein n=1 Tax=Blastopirellula sediminis TaxID=2894196 RepID=A0A9X1SGP1_9BACT|nr:hypothetical protein [Blastopirellula sediminis]MCC9607129.1 hypothetical protein [Blastopirellula sediminis]MCC9629578.1 hypothetical protein [Blastopirellula sediminis]